MIALLALSTVATLALIAAVVIGLAFAAGLVLLALRRRGEQGPDIPPGMRPGPSDQVLERRHLEKTMGWGILFVAIIAIWLPAVWLREPDQNVDDAIELVNRSVARGEKWFELATEENPTGFGCARCHGAEAQGGSVPFTNPDTGEFIPAYPVPQLSNVCGGPKTGHPLITSLDAIQTTIMEGRAGTPMPSWSVRFAGPMNDQQIQDLIAYLVSIQKGVPHEENLCTNPAAAAALAAPQPAPSASESPGDASSPEPGASPTEGAG
jgi:mono/diheme cytochrome c family protein